MHNSSVICTSSSDLRMIFLFFRTSRLPLGPTQPLMKWAQMDLHLGVKEVGA
jgi:hypothetical protein